MCMFVTKVILIYMAQSTIGKSGRIGFGKLFDYVDMLNSTQVSLRLRHEEFDQGGKNDFDYKLEKISTAWLRPIEYTKLLSILYFD